MRNYYDLFSFGKYLLMKSDSFPVPLILFASSCNLWKGKTEKGLVLFFFNVGLVVSFLLVGLS